MNAVQIGYWEYLLGLQSLNAQIHGATGDGITDDTAALQDALNICGQTGRTLFIPPGNYIVSSPLLWDTRASSVVTLAPSIKGSDGMSGPSRGSGYTMGVVQLTASASFPVGEYMIDYLGPAPAGSSAGNTGFSVSGLILQCGSRAAGIRSFNSENSNWHNLVINQPATPNPQGFSSGNDLGAVNFCSNPTSESYQNRAERIFVYGAGRNSFNLQEGTGSLVYALNCVSVNAGNIGYCVGGYTNLMGCVEQGSVNAGYQLKGALINLSNCITQSEGNTSKNAIQVVAGAGVQYINIIGGTYHATNQSSLTAKNGALMYFFGGGKTNVNMTGVSLRPGAGAGTYPMLYIDSSATGSWTMTGCDILQGSDFASNSFSTIITNNSTGAFRAIITDCPGINPFGSQTISVPNSGSATTALPYNAIFYVTAGATGTTTMAVSNGPTVTIPTSACVPIYVPANGTLTPTYSSSPTWVVQGM